MTNAIQTILQQFCHDSGIEFHRVGPSSFVSFYSSQHGKLPVFCHIDGNVLCFSSVLPFSVPKAKQPDVLVYLNLVNLQVAVGNFEMEQLEGEIRFRTSLDCANGALTPHMFAALLLRNLLACEHYLPGLLRILFANARPGEAIQAITAEEDTDDEGPDADDVDELLSDVNLDQLPEQGDD